MMHKILKNAWPLWVGVIVIGSASTLQFILLGRPWGITDGEVSAVALIESLFIPEHVLSATYFEAFPPVITYLLIIDVMLIVGAFISAKLSGMFKIRIPRKKERLIQGFAGGILMGFGARLAMGCNVGHIVSGIPQLYVASIIAGLSMIIGMYIGSKILLRQVRSSW